jgi:hypothetical protein
MPRKIDHDKADEGATQAPDVNADPQTPKDAQTFREDTKAEETRAISAPRAMPATKFEGHRDPAKVAIDQRIRGAYQLGGVWYAADGSTLNAVETQQAHRAMDAAATEARRKALLGGNQ